MRNLLLNKWGPEFITSEGPFVFEALNPENEKTLYVPRVKTLEETVEDSIGDGYGITKSINSNLLLVHEGSEYQETPNSLGSAIKWGLRKAGIQDQMGKPNYRGMAKAACVPLALLTAYSVAPNVFTAPAYADDLDINKEFSKQIPIQEGYWGGVSQMLCDLNKDGIDEVLVNGNRKVYAWNEDGTPYLNNNDGTFFSLDKDVQIYAPLAIGDVTGDGVEEVVILADKKVHVTDNLGNLINTFNIGGESYVAPVIADIDLDGKGEIMVVDGDSSLLYVYNIDGIVRTGFPIKDVEVSPAIADLDPNFYGLELILGKKDGTVCVVHHDVTDVTGFPKSLGKGRVLTPSVGDIDNDGNLDIIIGTSYNTLFVIEKNGKDKTGWPTKIELSYQIPSLADIYGNGQLAIFISDDNGYLYGFKPNGESVEGYPKKEEDTLGLGIITIADIDNNKHPEILVPSLNGFIYAWKTTGQPFTGFPLKLGQPSFLLVVGRGRNNSTLIGTSASEVGEDKAYFFLYRLGQNTWNPKKEWPSPYHDDQNTKNYHHTSEETPKPQDTTPPYIVFTPAHGSDDVPRNTTVLADITDDGVGVNPKSLEFILNGQSIPRDSLVIDETNKGLLVSYNDSFEYGSKVDIEVRVEDNNTNRVVHKISFDIEKNPDNLPPTVSSCRPKPDDETTSPYRIHAEFYDNESVEPRSIWMKVNGKDADIIIEEIIGGKKVVGYSADYFLKDALLGEVLVEVGAKDVNGNEMSYNYSFTVKESGLKRIVSSNILGENNINNNPENALELDNEHVSLGVGGEIVVDMGIDGIVDIPGDDFTVYEAQNNVPAAPAAAPNATGEGYTVYASNNLDNWSELGKGKGTTGFDLAVAGLKSTRYVKIVDDGDGDPNEQNPGFDLDAIVIKSGEAVDANDKIIKPWADQKEGINQYKKTVIKTGLFQNYPNPFNPGTWIPYQLSESGEVTIVIYNVNGELVKTLGLGYKEQGIYIAKDKSAYWDGRNDFGESLASGIYFYQIQTQGFTATRKMLLEK